MSEDDNTNGADDSAYSSHVINEDTSLTVPTSTSGSDICHTENSIVTSPRPSLLVDATMSTLNASQHQMTTILENAANSNPSPDGIRETIVSSTNMIENERLRTPESDASSNLSTTLPTDLTINGSSSAFVQIISMPTKPPPTKSTAPDISGLQLLSNSILAYEKNTFIKQEPIDRPIDHSPTSVYEPVSIFNSNCNTETITNDLRRQSTDIRTSFELPSKEATIVENCTKDFVSVAEPLGGLNLLCALAEQRFQEEVGSGSGSGSGSGTSGSMVSSLRKRSSSSDASESKRAKKHKEKHSSKKAKKKERKEKKRHAVTEEVIAEKEFKETYDRVIAKHGKCDCRKGGNDEQQCCCRSNWLTPEQVYSAMKTEYRDRLAEIAREFQEKKRKLDAINNKETRLQRESTPSSSKSSGSSSKLSTSIPTYSPSFLSSSSLDHCSTSNGKVQSDSESCSSTSSKRKHFIELKSPFIESDAQTTKKNNNKNLIGSIFASKKRNNDSNSFSTTDEASSDISSSLKRVTSIKQETYEFDESSSPPEMNLFGNFGERKLTLAETMTKNQKLTKEIMSKHHKKSKTNKEHKHHRHSELRERKRRITNRCTLTEEHLDTLVDGKKMRVLTAMGGLFYAGCLNAVQPPDVYAVTLDGERGNRPHIMSREEILRDAVSISIENVKFLHFDLNFIFTFQ